MARDAITSDEESYNMNTYRVYILTATAAALMSPTASVAFIQAPKYGDAWKTSRGILRGETGEGQAHAGATFYSDVECKEPVTVDGPNSVVARIDDSKPRNVKIDKTALNAILGDANRSDADKLAAMSAFLSGGTITTAVTTTPEDAATDPATAEEPAPTGRGRGGNKRGEGQSANA